MLKLIDNPFTFTYTNTEEAITSPTQAKFSRNTLNLQNQANLDGKNLDYTSTSGNR